jgi:hypothetical protein
MNFSAILDRPANEIEKPKPLPVGTYTAVVRGMPEFFESSKKKTPGARFTLEMLAAGEDVDQDDLEAMGGFEGKTLRHDLWLNDDLLWRAKDFVEACGLDTSEGSIGQLLEACNGAQVMIEVRHEPALDGSDSVFARVGKVKAI